MEEKEPITKTTKLGVDFVYLRKLNYAMLHNGISLVAKFAITNNSDADMQNLVVKVIPADAFVEPYESFVEFLPKGDSVEMGSYKPIVNGNFILQLTERTESSFHITVSNANEVIFDERIPITILTFNEWPGVNILPSLLASFVTPNSPALTPILNRAADVLKEWTGDSALDGYQSKDANRVRKMAAAVYQAVSEQNVIYSNPPASFEANGQRIRLADDVLSSLLGTCLDTTVLYASCLEAIGLYPLLVIVQGHAFAGVWLVADSLSDAFTDDISLLLKHRDLNDLELVETTLCCDGHKESFDDAHIAALAHLDNREEFVGVVDVMRCRVSNILPLPQRNYNGDHWEVESRTEKQSDTDVPLMVDRWEIQSAVAPELTKQNIWERKLLDLSLRNALLNYRFSKKSVVLIPPALGKFEDEVQKCEDFEILPLQKDMNVSLEDGKSFSYSSSSPLGQLLDMQLQKHRVYSILEENDHKEALKNLYRAAKVSLEENGANSLYLAIGMLEWCEPKVSTLHYAPLLLVPMEMVRHGAGCVVRARDEDTLLNVTLVEMLRQNFQITIGGLDPLPVDESGVDVDMVMAVFRNAIMDQKGWNVLNMAVLANFSFSKFIMWNDIHCNLASLTENKIVKSLVNGKLDFDVFPNTLSARQLDHDVTPSHLALPVAADSSQLEAVYASASGNSFILHGPPGTGKSQTITNIIANALYQGKRVLFAAEKMAALSVVKERLTKIGLGPFCLELHSNKAKKSDVLAQLQASCDVTKVKSPAGFEAEAAKLFELRQKLNAYVDALHKPSFCGVSLYEAITRYCHLEKNGSEVITIPQEALLSVSSDTFQAWNTAIEELVVVAGSCGNPANHPLRYLNFQTFEADMATALKALTEQAVNLLGKIVAEMKACNPIFSADSKLKFDTSLHLAELLCDLSGMNSTIVNQQDIAGNTPHIVSLLEHGKLMQSYREELYPNYKDDVFALSAEELKREWLDAEEQMFLKKWWTRRGIKKQLTKFTHKGVTDPLHDLELIIKVQAEKRVLDAHKSDLSIFGLPDDVLQVSQWEALSQTQQKLYAIFSDLAVLCPGVEQLRAARQNLSAQLAEGAGYYNQSVAPAYRSIADLALQLNNVNEQLKNNYGMLTFAVSDEALPYVGGRIAALKEVGANLNLLADRFNYIVARQKLRDLGMDFFIERVEAQPLVGVDEWKDLLLRSFYHALAEYLFAQDQNLVLFKGNMFDANIRRFRDLNAQYQELVKAEIYARLAAKHPDFTIEASNSSEVGVLQKNLRNKGRGTSLRTLFDQIPNMLSRLTPCMLMSPMSIAQYLDVKKQPKFDLIIFDEASQMPTSEAVGAIARGENVIVVGDPKQMPPTSFFSVNNDDEDNVDLNDLESILDDCLAMSIPSQYLQYHYRSKHESLISFSNSQYYDSKLVTFPSPDDRVSKVTMVKVDGHYDKGKSRQNKAEAQAVVDEVVNILSDDQRRKYSVGIVTFSVVQQRLIDDMLTEVFAKHPELDATANQCAEPLFVKNLENVQGDERDIILFSVGYGPDENGRVSMNFGPLNQVGGERRLNVAVSRARYEMKVFSTLTADMIDLNRTNAEGVRGLKEFLAFAQHGTRVLTKADMDTVKNYESVADLIADELRAKGYEVDTKVGNSSFRVDVAVIDPDDKGRYLLGILCDGDAYYNAPTARDREICQPGILQNLGWNLVKVWTVDWWNNKQKVLDYVAEAVMTAKSGTVPTVNAAVPKTVKLVNIEPQTKTNEAGGIEKREYSCADIEVVGLTADGLMDAGNTKKIVAQMKQVLKYEAPVTANYLQHRVAEAWGVTRITARVDARLKEILALSGLFVAENAKQQVVWNSADEAEAYSSFRVSSDRESIDIPLPEYACAMRYVVAQQIALPADDLKKQTSALMGFARMGSQLDTLLTEALALMLQRNIFVEEGGKLKMP